MTIRHWRGTTLAALLLAATLTGCASPGPTPQRYTLPETADATQTLAGAEAEYLLLLRPPRLAHYLDVDGLVMQVDDITLVEARGHQWAEALGRQLERGLRARLAARLPDTRVMLDEAGAREPAALSLRLELDRFQGRHDGLAVIGGQWQLRDAEGRLLAMEGLRVTAELDDDGYPALVRALGRGWDRVADELAEAVRRAR
ncbi:ABC-type transport auxiliary lipoprotein family protein [Halomonas sp. BM-2019]|uniref:PqiC family protein n=1 Tax=Halomonas sp. BM-2019 TaxID=2811227 RepID=UPI001B3C2504|nr:MAG: membrane integrity-associated transporter subunit PqiC [Halomonas sp. BM-2019]